jgi:hypothetical protein
MKDGAPVIGDDLGYVADPHGGSFGWAGSWRLLKHLPIAGALLDGFSWIMNGKNILYKKQSFFIQTFGFCQEKMGLRIPRGGST